jgi:hypothetical protein
VRITLPHLPQQADMETLEVTESGTWSDLSVVHRDLITDQLSPPGLANRYGAIPFAFPAAVEFNGLGAISDALVARRRHDKLTVVSEKVIILKGTTEQRQQYIASWRQRATNVISEAFETVKEIEIRSFGEKSLFFRKSLFYFLVEQGADMKVKDQVAVSIGPASFLAVFALRPGQ